MLDLQKIKARARSSDQPYPKRPRFKPAAGACESRLKPCQHRVIAHRQAREHGYQDESLRNRRRNEARELPAGLMCTLRRLVYTSRSIWTYGRRFARSAASFRPCRLHPSPRDSGLAVGHDLVGVNDPLAAPIAAETRASRLPAAYFCCEWHLWPPEHGVRRSLTRYARNGDPLKILNSIADAFNTDIFTEYEPQFWGFETEEEMEAALEKIAMQHKAEDLKFEAELLKYVRGEPNNIKEGSDAEAEAKIAKRLAEEFAALLRPENRELFRKEIRRIYGVEVLDLPF